MTTKAKRKVRKPRKYTDWGWLYHETGRVYLEAMPINAKDCRKLAAWLIKAADYLENRNGN